MCWQAEGLEGGRHPEKFGVKVDRRVQKRA
jgi:hypothetical protein